MMRGTFANIRLRNALAGDREGPLTTHLPSGDILPVADAAARYAESATPLVIIAGKEYGSGSSRDWAAKGTQMLGVRAVIAESYERIHRSNLIGMGILPLQFLPGEGAARHGLTGRERFTLQGLAAIGPRERITMLVDSVGDDGATTGDRRSIDVIVRLDGPIECDTYRQGGIMPAVLRRMAKQ
jgi:aconitate hydratase